MPYKKYPLAQEVACNWFIVHVNELFSKHYKHYPFNLEYPTLQLVILLRVVQILTLFSHYKQVLFDK